MSELQIANPFKIIKQKLFDDGIAIGYIKPVNYDFVIFGRGNDTIDIRHSKDLGLKANYDYDIGALEKMFKMDDCYLFGGNKGVALTDLNFKRREFI